MSRRTDAAARQNQRTLRRIERKLDRLLAAQGIKPRPKRREVASDIGGVSLGSSRPVGPMFPHLHKSIT